MQNSDDDDNSRQTSFDSFDLMNCSIEGGERLTSDQQYRCVCLYSNIYVYNIRGILPA